MGVVRYALPNISPTGSLMKKLLFLLVLVVIGVAVARKLRET